MKVKKVRMRGECKRSVYFLGLFNCPYYKKKLISFKGKIFKGFLEKFEPKVYKKFCNGCGCLSAVLSDLFESNI